LQNEQAFDDELLGPVSWNVSRRCWEFDAGPVRGQPVPTSYTPPGRGRVTAGDWNGVRACVRWLRDYESEARTFIAERLFPLWRRNWCQEADDVNTEADLRERLSLSGVHFDSGREAVLVYQAGDLFGGRRISLHADATGQYLAGPDLFG
jgi:hypothetical protein